MKHIQKGLAVCLAVVLLMGQGVALARVEPGPEPDDTAQVKGILYKIENGKNTLYLLGSIHIGNEEMYPFGEQIQSAMDQADTFLFECDTTSAAAVKTVMASMYYSGTTKVSDEISPALYAKLQDVCKQTGISISLLNSLKPWAVMSTLSLQATAAEMGMDSLDDAEDYGVETKVMEYVTRKKKGLDYVETAQEQLNVMDGFSMTLQEYLLEQVLDVILAPGEATGMDADMDQWPGWWRDGNRDAFVNSFQLGYEADPEKELVDEYYAGLIYQRNATMAQRLDAMLQEGGGRTYFATIGLLHVVLPQDSIVKHMEDMGYQITFLSGE